MLVNNKEKKLANKIRNMLNKRGFIVEMQTSRKSKSIYLKIDNGACPSIRISDHKNDKANSKFNMIRNYKGKRMDFKMGKAKLFYSFMMIGRLIADVEIERSNEILKYGYSNYKKIRDGKVIANNFTYNNRKAA